MTRTDDLRSGSPAGPKRYGWATGLTPATAARQLACGILGLGRYGRVGLAFVSGGVSVLALAPFFLFPILFLTLPTLVWLIDAAIAAPAATGAAGRGLLRHRVVRSAAVGWLFGFGYFAAGLFWIGEAFLVEADRFAWALPFAVTLLPAGLALFYGAATAAAALFWQAGLMRLVALALSLSAAEWLRGHILTGFPWNVLGYSLTYPLELMQSASVFGIYGLTLLAVLVFSAPLVLLAHPPSWAQGYRAVAVSLAIAAGPISLAWIYGAAQLSVSVPAPIPGVQLRLVQPSVPQRDKWLPEKARDIFIDHLVLSMTRPDGQRDDLAGVTHVVWPEAAMPFLPLNRPEALKAIGDVLPPGTSLLAGALRLDDAVSATGRRKAYNSLIALDSEGALTTLYDKIHLVPFGEYLPLQPFLESVGIEQLTRWRGGFTSGTEPRPLLRVPGLPPIGVLICYEAIFPGAVVQGPERPQALINVTNDGWFGNTTGPQQHFHQARVRAVEEGLALIRVANNGVSAAIDPRGRVLARLNLNTRGTIDTPLPSPLSPPLYARYGDSLFALCWLALLTGLFWHIRHRKRAVEIRPLPPLN